MSAIPTIRPGGLLDMLGLKPRPAHVTVLTEPPDFNPMAERNFENRALFHSDNLPVLRAMNSESVDLIATDPPFNKSKDFHATPDSLAAGVSFQDRWSWERDVHEDWVDQITDDLPKLMEAIESARYAHSDGMGAFMCFMAVRLLEMRRVLKPTGSIYLHCDPTASHYLKAVMDAIFGRKNFSNEIVWCYKDVGGGRNTPYYKRKHDVILWYAKDSKNKKVNELARGALSDTTIDRFGSLFDVNGIITYRKLKEKRPREFASRELQGRVPENLDDVFLSKKNGRLMEDYWVDINPVRKRRKGDNVKEVFMYPTQKPLALYERIIKASSSEGDMVLDPFAGCTTTLIAAEKLKRQWIGIDIWGNAKAVVLQRLEKEGLIVPETTDGLHGHLFPGDVVSIDQLPTRTDTGESAAPNLRTKVRVFEPRGQKMSRAQMYEHLLEQYGSKCQGCDRTFDDKRYLQLDHNTPRADGGLNHISNRVLLCGPCNRLKSHVYTLSGLRRENKKRGFMYGSR